MASIPPQLTAAQRAAALAKSLEARRARSALKAEIASGDRTIFDAINSHEPAITQMRVRELLTSVPGIGATKAELLMERAKISPTRRIAGLGSHQILIKCKPSSGFSNGPGVGFATYFFRPK